MIAINNTTPFSVYSRAGFRAPETFSILHPAPWAWTLQVVVKATFSLPGGSARAIPQLDVRAEDGEEDGMYVESDVAFEKQGTDLVIVGKAFAPRQKPIDAMEVSVRVGERIRRYMVTGDRKWLKHADGPRTSDPVPFLSVPLDYRHAFGGTYRLSGGGEIPFVRNPVGKGWVPQLSTADYDQQPLPNFEALDRRVSSPYDDIEPAGVSWYPPTWGLRLMHGLEIQDSGPPKVLPRFWNAAHPDWVLPAYPVGQRLRLEGFQPGGALDVEVPPLPVVLEHSLNGARVALRARPDTLCIAPSAGWMYVLARWMLPYKPDSASRRSEVRLTLEPDSTPRPGGKL